MTRIMILSLAIIMLPCIASAETKVTEFPDRLMVEITGEVAPKETSAAAPQLSAEVRQPETSAESRREPETVQSQIAGRRAEAQALRRAPEYESDSDRAERMRRISEKMNELRSLEADTVSDRVPGNGYTY